MLVLVQLFKIYRWWLASFRRTKRFLEVRYAGNSKTGYWCDCYGFSSGFYGLRTYKIQSPIAIVNGLKLLCDVIYHFWIV